VIVTLTGKGTGGNGTAGRSERSGVVTTALSAPFRNVSVHAPRSASLNSTVRAQKLRLTARPTRGMGVRVVEPCEAWRVVPASPFGTTLAPNWMESPWAIRMSFSPLVSCL
jgi:hypothetical protein